MSPQEQIAIKEQELLAALQANDCTALDNLLHNDLLFILPTGHTITKELDIATYRSGNMVIAALVTDGQHINVIEDTAVVSVRIHFLGRYYKELIDATFNYLRVWKLCDGEWRVIAGSATHDTTIQ
jgi:hypothetical protein